MTASISTRTADRLRVAVTPRRLAVLLVVLNVEAALVVGYLAVTDATVTTPRHLVYPFVWLNVAGWAVWSLDVPEAPRRRRLLAGGVAAVYVVAMLAFAGLVGVGRGGTALGVTWAVPGWGPIVHLGVGPFGASLIPFMVVGYVALGVLGYAALLDAASSAVPGVVGLVSCVGCTWPIASALVATAAGGTAGVGAAVTEWSYGLSTVVFVAAIALLYWRPGT
jgi:hypothetical protein